MQVVGSLQEVASGCITEIVPGTSGAVVVHLLVKVRSKCIVSSMLLRLLILPQGLINIEAEIAKCQKQQAYKKGSIETLQNRMSQPSYASKASEETKQRDIEIVGVSALLLPCALAHLFHDS